MKYLFRLKHSLRDWLGAAPNDEFARLLERHQQHTSDVRQLLRLLEEQQHDLSDQVRILRDGFRMMALRVAKIDVEAMERHDATKSA